MTRPMDYLPEGYPIGRVDAPRELRPDTSAPAGRYWGEGMAAPSPPEEPARPAPAGLEERVAHLEKMNALLWKAIAKLEGKPVADG